MRHCCRSIKYTTAILWMMFLMVERKDPLFMVQGFVSFQITTIPVGKFPNYNNNMNCYKSMNIDPNRCRARRRFQHWNSYHNSDVATDENNQSGFGSSNIKGDVSEFEQYKDPRYWNKPVYAIAFPALLGMMSDPLLSLIDTIFVGQLNNQRIYKSSKFSTLSSGKSETGNGVELGALGACTSIFHLAFNTFKATTSVTTTLVSNAIATSDEDDSSEEKNDSNNMVQQVLSTSLGFAFITGMLLSTLLLTNSSTILKHMSIASNSPLYNPAKTYLSFRAFAAPAVLTLSVCEGAFRGIGDTMVPLLASSFASIGNLILDYALMFGVVHWGIGGAAIATAASQYLACIIYFVKIRERGMLPKQTLRNPLKLSREEINVKFEIVKEIFLANTYMLSRQLSLMLLWASATARATLLGYEHVAAHQIALSYWLLFILLLDGPAVAAQVITNRILYSESLDEDIKSFADKKEIKISSSVTQNNQAVTTTEFERRIAFTSFTMYLTKLLAILSTLTTAVLLVLPNFKVFYTSFTTNVNVMSHLRSIVPTLALQQGLMGFTLALEGILSGANLFRLLSICTSFSAIVSYFVMRSACTIREIWSRGITLFIVLRCLSSAFCVFRLRKKVVYDGNSISSNMKV